MQSTPTTNELVAWIGEWMSRELELGDAAVDPERPFVSYGMDSIHAMMLVGDLEEQLGRRLPPTLTWDHSSVSALARHLAPPPAEVAPMPEHVLDELLGDRGGIRDVQPR